MHFEVFTRVHVGRARFSWLIYFIFIRMRESEKLFGEILNCIFFLETPFIVFFNKVDLFQAKLKTHRLSDYLPEYSGSDDCREAL